MSNQLIILSCITDQVICDVGKFVTLLGNV